METLRIEGVIGRKGDPSIAKGDKSFSFADLQNFLDTYGGGPFRAVFKSPGGSVEEGFKIYNELKKHEVHTEAIIANSIASVAFMAGKTRKVYPDTQMIIHNAWLDAEALAGEKLNFHTLNALTSAFAEMDSQILSIYAGVAGDDKASKILALMAQETNVSADLALSLNFATEIATEEAKALSFKNKVLTYCKNHVDILALQDGPIKTYADVIYLNEAGQVLLLKRPEADDFEPGKWGFPGGKVMQGETTEAGALREFSEEIGEALPGVERLGEEVNEDESLTVYFAAVGNLPAPGETPEHEKGEYVDFEQLDSLPVIKGQNERFKKVIQQTLTKFNMDHKEKINAFEKALNGFKNLFKGAFKNMAVMAKDGTALFIGGAEEGDLVGKPVFLAVEGLPTEEKAPAGSYELEDGKVITVDEAGLISEVKEAAATPPAEDVTALKAAFDEKEKEMQANHAAEVQALKEQINNLTKTNSEAAEKLNALAQNFAELKNQVIGDPDKKGKEEPVGILSKEDWAKLSPGEKLRRQAMNRAESLPKK